jgi:hypothetical protein
VRVRKCLKNYVSYMMFIVVFFPFIYLFFSLLAMNLIGKLDCCGNICDC